MGYGFLAAGRPTTSTKFYSVTSTGVCRVGIGIAGDLHPSMASCCAVVASSSGPVGHRAGCDLSGSVGAAP